MVPADGVLRAANRWLSLLATGDSVSHAWAVVRSNPGFSDASVTQYASALDWLTEHGLVTQNHLMRSTDGHVVPPPVLYAHMMSSLAPTWLADADILIGSPDDLPFDADVLAQTFGVDADAALAAILAVQRKVDLDSRTRIGLAGEMALIEWLEARWPGSTLHVSRYDDSAGFDVQFSPQSHRWHLEVKTTIRRGRLTIHLTRNEYRVGRNDVSWALIVVGLDQDGELAALATVQTDILLNRVPRDVSPRGHWESAAIDLLPTDLIRGLALRSSMDQLLDDGLTSPEFAWLP